MIGRYRIFFYSFRFKQSLRDFSISLVYIMSQYYIIDFSEKPFKGSYKRSLYDTMLVLYHYL